MQFSPNSKSSVHNLLLENREKLNLTGVKDVNNFDDKQIVAITEMGYLTIKGNSLHISKFDTNNGELNVVGKVNELVYANKKIWGQSYEHRCRGQKPHLTAMRGEGNQHQQACNDFRSPAIQHQEYFVWEKSESETDYH